MKKISITIFLLLVAFCLTSCARTENEERKVDTSTDDIPVDSTDIVTEENQMTIEINNIAYSVTLEESDTVNEFLELLPLELTMQELNGNEKYAELSTDLTTHEAAVGEIHSGDIMLYGSNTLVLFYKDFSTPYSYTPIGHIDDPKGLEENVGTDSVNVIFNK